MQIRQRSNTQIESRSMTFWKRSESGYSRNKEFYMTQFQAIRSIIDTHRHIFGPKLRQKLVENMGFDDSKPLPQVFGDEMFFYRESLDVDCSMEMCTRPLLRTIPVDQKPFFFRNPELQRLPNVKITYRRYNAA